ncbi:hypothetical protein BDV41DRAFT_529939, partial [Aspergillus transmontanensis]
MYKESEGQLNGERTTAMSQCNNSSSQATLCMPMHSEGIPYVKRCWFVQSSTAACVLYCL